MTTHDWSQPHNDVGGRVSFCPPTCPASTVTVVDEWDVETNPGALSGTPTTREQAESRARVYRSAGVHPQARVVHRRSWVGQWTPVDPKEAP